MNRLTIAVLPLLLLFVFSSQSLAQVSAGGQPYSFLSASKADVETHVMQAVDVERLLAEDAIEEELGMPFRFGAPFEVDYDLYNSGTWDDFPDGSRIWRLRIESPGASSINLIYSNYYLPEGARLFVYSEDREMVLGAFTDFNNKSHGEMATAPVKGEVTIVEYYEPADMRGVGQLTISRVVHGYKDIFKYLSEKGFGSSGSCNNNVNCPEGDPWQDETRGVAMVLLSGGTRWCTGSMINNVREDGTQYFLSANHCLGSESTWIIMFNYQSPGCSNVNGPTNQTVQGTTLRASYSSSDFALLELQEAIPESYNIYFNGWSNINTASTQSVGIHHPAGDIKKISFDYDASTTANYLQTSGTTHWRVGNWEDGTTEGGSSGSPLFDQNHKITGQLHGGYASCASITADWYGKFSMSWDGGGSSSNRLKDWLDPDNTGATTLEGYDPFASVAITHSPLINTFDTVSNYEVVCTIKSNEALIGDSLQLHYELDASWYTEILTATGGTDEFHGFIPAQSGGSQISYYLTAWDVAVRTDTTDTYIFNIEYSPAIMVVPGDMNVSVVYEDSTTENLYVTNINEGTLDYSISTEYTPYFKSLLDDLISEDRLEPATRAYPPDFDDFDDYKGALDTRSGFAVEKDAGGPDLFGYFWIDSDDPDGPTFSWEDISGTGTDISAGIDDDNYVGPFSIGFSFNFYGNSYSQFYVGSNGIIGFGTTEMDNRQKKSIPTAEAPNDIIAWLWDDLDITDDQNTNGAVFMSSDAEKCIVQFDQFPEYNAQSGDIVTAQVILYGNGNIEIKYLSIGTGFDIANCAIGIENSTGTDGLEVAYLTGSYLHDNLSVLFTQPEQWLSYSKTAGSLVAGEIDTVEVKFKSGSLADGDYFADIEIRSNDPDPEDTLVVLATTMTVTGSILFVCGDVNEDDDVNVLDITAVIDYLYYDDPAPDPLERADVNSDLAINILDVSYLINYLYNSGPPPNCP